MPKLKPMNGFVLIKDKKDQTVGNFVIASEEKEREAVIGDVIDTSAGLWHYETGMMQECPVQIGNVIIFKKYHCDSVTYDGESFKFVHFNDIVGVINEG